MAAQYISDHNGRRCTFLWAAGAYLTGCLIMAASINYGMLLTGRVCVGLGIGLGLGLDPLYIAEVTPAAFRGELVTWAGVSLNLGILLGFGVSWSFEGMDDSLEWRLLFLTGGIAPTTLMCLIWLHVLPESPRWLVSKGRFEDTRAVLRKIYPTGAADVIDSLIEQMSHAIALERMAKSAVGWKELLLCHRATPVVQRMLLVGVGIPVAQQLIGIDAIQYYLLDIMEEVGMDSTRHQSMLLVVVAVVKLILNIVAGQLFDSKGRKPVLLVSVLGMILTLLLMSVTMFFGFAYKKVIIGLGCVAYLGFYAIGIGPGAWLVASEVFSSSIRAKAMSIATVSNRISATLLSSTALTLIEFGLGNFFLIWACVSAVMVTFIYIYLPETKGRSLEEMAVYFASITGDRSMLEAEARLSSSRLSLPQLESQIRQLSSKIV